MWILTAFLSAFFASLVAILGKLGLKGVDPTLATTIRGVIMAIFLLMVSGIGGKFAGFGISSLSGKDWILILFSGLAGALSWLFYFFALRSGNAIQVATIDRLSIVFVILFASLFLGESVSWKVILGGLCVALGAILITYK